MKKTPKQRSDTLLVLCSASLGGPTSSAINLLRLFRQQGKTLDVFLMDQGDVRTKDIAEEGNLLPIIPILADAITNRKNIKTISQFVRRTFFVVTHKLLGVRLARESLYKRAARKLKGKYKNIISYQESITSDFVRYIDAPNRIGWMHTDYNCLCKLSPYYASREIYDNYDHIASVTLASAESMVQKLGRDSRSVHVIKNPLIPEVIIEKSLEKILPEEKKKKTFLIISVGRLSAEKAFHRIPRVAKRLKESNIDFDWYIIGDGTTREQIEAEILCTGTKDAVHLLGSKMNPYPYIQMSDVLVITSEHEAQPMVANEALILDTPVVSTDFASAREVISDEKNGIIVKQDENAIFEALKRFCEDEVMRLNLSRGAKAFNYDNNSILEEINSLLI